MEIEENPIEEKKTATTKFAEWLMARQEKKEAKETSLEGLMKFNIFLSIGTLIAEKFIKNPKIKYHGCCG